MESGGEGLRKSCILMIYPDRANNSLSDYIEIRALLNKYRLPVPEILGVSEEDGVCALEDLGNKTLQTAISDEPESINKYYRLTVEMLAKMQSSVSRDDNGDCAAFRRRFDKSKFFSELDFFRENYIEKLLGRSVKKSHKEIIDKEFLRLSGLLADYLPVVFAHRDFHSRNLMVTKNNIVMIDFQDARLGLPQYDLVSLLRDSYVEFEAEFVEEMIAFYFECRIKFNFPIKDKDVFMAFYHLCAIQRNLKAVGTFAFQKASKGKDGYLCYIPPTLAYVKNNPLLESEFSTLGEVLDIYAEWQE